MPCVGARVNSELAGAGVVIRIENGGRDWIVVFDKIPRVPYRLGARYLRVLSRPAEPPGASGPAPATKSMAAPVAKAKSSSRTKAPNDPIQTRQCIEAIRMGVVPTGGLDRVTVGRDAELASLDDMLDDARGLRVLCGNYGTGKSHLIEVVESRARAGNLLVARASFDPEELPPSHPMRLYEALVASLSYPDDSRSGLRPLLDRLVDRLGPNAHRLVPVNRWLSPALWARGNGVSEELLHEAIAYASGEPYWPGDLEADLARAGWRGEHLLILSDYRTYGQIMANLLGALATWAKAAGYRGLVVLLDEAEYLDSLGTTSRAMAENVLRFLAVGCLDPSRLAFDPAVVYRGGHEVHKRTPACFAPEQPLSVVCALTPHPGINGVLARITNDADVILAIDSLGRGQLATLGDKVIALVQEVYPEWTMPEKDRGALTLALVTARDLGHIDSTRDAARMVVEFCDLHRIDPLRARRALR